MWEATLSSTSFPSIPPWGHGAFFPPPLSPSCFPGQVHPGRSTARGQSATFQWLNTLGEGSGFLHGGWGGARRQAGRRAGESSAQADGTHVPTALGPRSWGVENNRGPRAPHTRQARESSSTSLGSNRRRGHHCKHRRNCKKPERSQHRDAWGPVQLHNSDSWYSNSSLTSGIFKVRCVFGWNRIPISLRRQLKFLNLSKQSSPLAILDFSACDSVSSGLSWCLSCDLCSSSFNSIESGLKLSSPGPSRAS